MKKVDYECPYREKGLESLSSGGEGSKSHELMNNQRRQDRYEYQPGISRVQLNNSGDKKDLSTIWNNIYYCEFRRPGILCLV